MDFRKKDLIEQMAGIDQYHTPHFCEKCGGVMIFKGVGEYKCEDCGEVAYDDYGKVRLYLEKNRGATAAEVEAETGVKQRTIRLMLKESRLEVTEDSKSFIVCEVCGKRIRSGRMCAECEAQYHREIENENRSKRKKISQGYSLDNKLGEGEKRFKRER